ncbi:hypothetical protein ACFOEE_06425 [Pseudoalteromonas fenneropenaei]|uniref:TIGR02270 family protein n=1 Tax=Pseudoalteromonas fenneropenaei TaxID=1737459 RepID=A0ABV7CHR6_9GAMM
MMFAKLNRAAQHQKRVAVLAKQRIRLQQVGVYPAARMAVLESQLLNHIYTLTTHDALAELAGLKLEQLATQDWQSFCLNAENAMLIENSNFDLLALCCTQLLKSLAPLSIESLMALGRENPTALNLLLQHPDNWNVQPDTAAINLLLEQPDNGPAALKYFLLSYIDAPSLVSEALAHSDFELIYPAFVNAYLSQQTGLTEQCFVAFARCDNPAQKAQLLAVGGLTGDMRWQEIADEFCRQHPQYCADVLSHFQHKSALKLVIGLLDFAPCMAGANSAWLNLTTKALKQVPQLAANGSTAQSTSNLNMAKRSSSDDAIYAEQQLRQQPGQWVWQGVSYDKANALPLLRQFAGLYSQRALCHALPKAQGAWAFWCANSSTQLWQKMVWQKMSEGAC